MSFEDTFNEPKDRYFASEDLNFQAVDSPVVLDIEYGLSTHSVDGEIYCNGIGNVLVELSMDGSTYGNQFTLLAYETFSLFGYKLKSIRFTHSGADSSYRVVAR